MDYNSGLFFLSVTIVTTSRINSDTSTVLSVSL